MAATQIEYVGFAVQGAAREYRLRVRQGAGDPREVIRAIPNEAFLDHRARYQDAPDICFVTLQRELLACADAGPQARATISDADLEDYRAAHAPKAPRRRSFTPPTV